jgi:hypothetical protein
MGWADVFKVLREGGVLGALVIALAVIAFMWRENKDHVKELLKEKDAHRVTAERVGTMAGQYAELALRVTERRPRAFPTKKGGGGGGGPDSEGSASQG